MSGGTDFPDEFSHSNDTKGLKGANMKAKANLTPAVGKLIQIAGEKTEYPDYNAKHGAKAKFSAFEQLLNESQKIVLHTHISNDIMNYGICL